MHAGDLVKAFETNELRAYETYGGQRVRIYGTINSIEAKNGVIVLAFKGSAGAYSNARCHFDPSQASSVAQLSANQEATVDGTVFGWEGGFGGARVFVLLEDCTVP
jgi:hypothetical protein